MFKCQWIPEMTDCQMTKKTIFSAERKARFDQNSHDSQQFQKLFHWKANFWKCHNVFSEYYSLFFYTNKKHLVIPHWRIPSVLCRFSNHATMLCPKNCDNPQDSNMKSMNAQFTNIWLTSKGNDLIRLWHSYGKESLLTTLITYKNGPITKIYPVICFIL